MEGIGKLPCMVGDGSWRPEWEKLEGRERKNGLASALNGVIVTVHGPVLELKTALLGERERNRGGALLVSRDRKTQLA